MDAAVTDKFDGYCTCVICLSCFLIGMDFCNVRNDFKEENGGKNGCGTNLVSSVFVTNRAAKLEET